MKFRNLKLILASTAISLVFVACGSDDTADTKTGVFTAGAPVQGLSYQTATKSGTTNDEGQFKYEEGETVTFKIGGKLNIGSASGASSHTPYTVLDLPNLQRNGTGNKNSTRVYNIARLLQILDTNQSNNLTIALDSNLTQINESALENIGINITDINFTNDGNITAIWAEANITRASNYANVAVVDARNRLNNYLLVQKYNGQKIATNVNYTVGNISYTLMDNNTYNVNSTNNNITLAFSGNITSQNLTYEGLYLTIQHTNGTDLGSKPIKFNGFNAIIDTGNFTGGNSTGNSTGLGLVITDFSTSTNLTVTGQINSTGNNTVFVKFD